MSSPLKAWHAACDRLKEMGARMTEAPFATDPGGQLEGFEHLADQLSLWLAWETLHADPTRPFFHRHNDLVSQWGGPNNDNTYRHARIDPTRRYRIVGRMHSCEEFLLAVRAGFMHRPVWGTVAQLTATDHGIHEGEDFELTLGGDRPDVELPQGAVMVSFREYYYDWRPLEPATITIECLDPEPPTPLTARLFEARLHETLNEIEESLDYWNDYLVNNRALRTDNSFTANTVKLNKGLADARYEFCFWDLAEDEALVIDCDQPDARYWSMHLYTMHNFEPVDPYAHISSRNHRQVEVSPDGRVRIVASATDPGVRNWLDVAGRRNGLCTLRWFWPHRETRPIPTTTVVPLAQVRSILPADTPAFTPSQRHTEVNARQAHLRWRFRT
ncbi:MAG: DUF1214 domain-containing protein [Acidimicrobiaceae bacterium]|nr:DUF1254 domain-containing protein [Acidimicrobiia bacterium]MCY4494638.1 DUF1214 domain-containing protein [Acidimicrobiaceae bacterium]